MTIRIMSKQNDYYFATNHIIQNKLTIFPYKTAVLFVRTICCEVIIVSFRHNSKSNTAFLILASFGITRTRAKYMGVCLLHFLN